MNKMHKRLLALVLVCALTLGVIPALTLPIFAVDSKENVYQAAHADSVALDGNLDEAFLTNGKMSEEVPFGVLWNRETLYLAVEPRAGDSALEVTLGEKKLTVTKSGVTGLEGAKSAWGKVIEVSIPNTVTEYGQKTALSLSMGNASWVGQVTYTSLVRTWNAQANGVDGWKLNNKNTWSGSDSQILSNGYRFSCYDAQEEPGNRVNLHGSFSLLTSRTANITVEFDFCGNNMPKYRPFKVTDTYISNGLLIVMADGQGDGFSAAISNTSEGLVFSALDANNSFSYVTLNKQVGETFRVRCDWTTDENLVLYIDGVQVHVFQNVTSTMKDRSWGGTNHFGLVLKQSEVPESPDAALDFTVTNIALGNSYDESPLAGLDFGVIAGANKSVYQVEKNLNLPTMYAHPSGHFPAKEIVWHSAREDYITADGKVTPHGTPLNVILTAALKENPSVSQQIVVKVSRKSDRFLVTNSKETTMKLDGTMSEGSGAWKTELPMSTTEGTNAPAGTLYGAWGQGNVYLAVKHSGAKTLTLRMNNRTITLDLTTGTFAGEAYGASAKLSGNIAEIYIPLQQIGMYAYQYEQTLRFEAKLAGDGGSAALYTYQMDIKLTSEVKYDQNLNDYLSHGDPDLSEDGSSVNFAPVIKPQGVKLDNLSAVDHSRELIVSQQLQFTKLPVSNSGFKSISDTADGYHFWVVDGAKGAEKAVLHTKIYNNGSSLILEVLKNSSLAVGQVDLGKTAGENSEAFTLKLIWGTDGSVKVFVDDVLKGTVTDVNVTCADDAMGYDGFQIHCTAKGIKATASSMTITAPPVSWNLSDAELSGDPAVSEDGNTVVLKPVVKPQAVVMNGLEIVDHAEDMIFSQYIRIDAMDASAGGFESTGKVTDGYHFWLIDGEATAMQYALNAKIIRHSEKGLILQILKNNNLEMAEITLNKTLGETFKLELHWGADHSVKVYVNGELKGSVSDLSLTYTGGMGNDGFQLHCATDRANVTVSDVTISYPPAYLALGTNSNVSADGTSVTLAPSVAAQSVLENGLAELDHSKNLALYQTIKVEAMKPSQGGFESLTDVTGGYHFWFVDGAENTTQYLVRGQIYNSANGLVLQIVKDNNLTVVDVPLGVTVGQSFVLKLLWDADNSLEVYVDNVRKATVSNLSLTCTGGMGHDGFQMHCADESTKLTVSDIRIETVYVRKLDNSVLLGGATLNADKTELTLIPTGGNQALLQKTGVAGVDRTKNMLFSQTIYVEAMPEGFPMAAASSHTVQNGTNYYFWLTDGASGQPKAITFANMYNAGSEKGLILQVEHADGKYTEIPLGKKVGDTFTLGYLWNTDGTVRVYVDEIYAGTCTISATWSSNTYTSDGCGFDGFNLRSKTEGTKVVVSNVDLSYVNVKQDLNGYTKAYTTVSGGVANITGSNDNPPLGYVEKRDLEVLDHSQDILLTYTLNLYTEYASRPVDVNNPANNGGTNFAALTTHSLMMVAGGQGEQKTVAIAHIYNHSENGLMLQVAHADLTYSEVKLNKKLGDTFTLAYLWGKDGTATIYVDNVKLGKFENVDYTGYGTSDSYGYDNLRLLRYSANTRVRISNVVIEQDGKLNPVIAAHDLSSATTAGDVMVDGTTASFDVKASDSININGLADIDHAKDMMFNQTIHVEAMPEGGKMEKSSLGYTVAGTNYYFWLIDGVSGATKTMTFANLYNAGGERGLVLQVQHGVGGFTEIPLGKKVGDTFTLGYLWSKDNSVRVYVDEVYAGSCAVSATQVYTADNRGYDGFSLRSGSAETKVTISNVHISHISVKQDMSGSDYTKAYVSISNGVAAFNGNEKGIAYVEKQGFELVDHSKDILVTYTLRLYTEYANKPVDVDNFAEPSSSYVPAKAGSHSLLLVDGGKGEQKTMTFATIYNHSEKGLVLQVKHADGSYSDVVLNKKLNDTFTFGYLWGKDGTATVYVDNVLMGNFENVDYTGDGTSDSLGYDNLRIYRTALNTKAQVSNVVVEQNSKLAPTVTSQNFGSAETAGDVMIENSTAIFDVKATGSLNVNDLAEIDHAQDMLFNQTIHVDAMPEGGMLTKSSRGYTVAGSSYYFWLIDGAKGADKAMTFANLYNAGETGLVLQVEHADGNFTNIPLGKKVGDTFTLGYLWSSSNVVRVYVDEVYVGSCTVSVTKTYAGDGRGYDGFSLRSSSAETKMTVSGVNVTHISIMQNLNSYTKAYSSVSNGIASLTGNAKGVAYIEQQGLIAMDHSKDILVTYTLRLTVENGAKPVDVDNFAMPSKSYVPSMSGSHSLLLVDGGKGEQKTMTFATIYNHSTKGLVLQVKHGDGTYSEVALNKKLGDTFEMGYLWSKDGTATVYVDGVLMGKFENVDYTGDGNSDSLGFDDLRLYRTALNTKAQISNVVITLDGKLTPVVETQSLNGAEITGDVVVKGTTASFDVVSTMQGFTGNEIPEIDHSRDLTLSQTIRVDEMPVDMPMESSNKHRMEGNGYWFNMTDGAKGEVKYITFANLYNSSKHGLVLQIENASGSMTDIVLGKTLGETFQLDYTWCADGSVKVYVDGVTKGSAKMATWHSTGYTGDGSGYDGLWLRARTEGVMKLSVSNVYLTPGAIYSSINEELTPDAVLEGVTKVDNVTETTLKLPEYFNSPYLGKVPLTWTSGDPSIINVETGKVTHSDKKVGTYVTLTATIKDFRDRRLFTIEVYVTGNGKVEIKSPNKLTAAFGDNVVIDGKFTAETDGKVTDEGWQMGTLLGETGRLGAQWDAKNLYLAVKDLDTVTEDTLNITLKGNSVNLGNAVTVDGVTEIAVPLSSLGIYADNYGIEIPAKVQLGEGKWEGTIVLSSTAWFSTDSTYPRLPVPLNVAAATARAETPATDFQGRTRTEYGYRFYDLYNINGANPHSIQSNVLLSGVLSTQEPWEHEVLKPMADKEVALFAEFDFRAMVMPEYILGTSIRDNPLYATCGVYWYVGRQQSQGAGPSISMGIINTTDGLYFVGRGERGDTFIRLGKELGDYFRIGTRWEIDGSVTLYIDGEEIAVIEKMEMLRRAINNGMVIGTLRSDVPASSSNDNLDVYVTNVAIGQNYGDTLLDTLTFNDIRGKNGKDMGAVTRDLKLVETWSTVQLPTPQPITWTSSDPSVLNAETGDVIRPEGNGKPVTLTATCGSETKVFELFVKGLNPDGLVMYVQDDRNTAKGVGKPENEKHIVTLDTDNSSIILDQGEAKKINVIELIDSDATNRLNESTLTIWYSDDNETYTEIDEYFKILRDGTKTYLYDFEVEARYIKVHCTHYNGAEADMINVLKDMIKVDYVSVFGDGDAAFATTSTVAVSNDKDNTIYDQYFTISPADAGVACVKEDKSDVRFFLGDELLYHYFDGTNFVVRVTKIPANGEVFLTVLSGNAEAMDISNKEYVYEVVYGTREGSDDDITRWLVTLPDGTLMGFKGTGGNEFAYRISTNKGMTWSAYEVIDASVNFMNSPQGAVYDDHNGRIIVQGRIPTAVGGQKTRFVYSDDLGKTWKACPELNWLGKYEEYAMQYCDPVIVSSYDGEGPNVDIVLPLAIGTIDKSIKGFEFYVRVAYSCDAGINWTVGEDEIRYNEGVGLFERENGVNESTVLEDDNGRLVMLSRCQYGNVDQFSVAYSYDFGLTWESANGKSEVEMSTVYAPNTQPILFEYNKSDLLLWGGNNVLGGNSYMRFPFNVGVSYDNMETFENIQDMYSRYSMQGVTMSTRTYITNHTVEKVGDSLVMIWNDDRGAPTLRVDHFTDYFYRTRGAYDSFENTTVKYEGWATGAGSAEVSGEQFTDGSKSMKISSASAVVRSVPYVQNGSVSFDLYLADVNAGEIQIELESAYSTEHGEAAPVAMTIRGGKLYFLAADRTQGEVEVAASLQNGWNHFVFDLALASEQPGVTLSANGGEAAAVPVALEIGDYVCFVHVSNTGRETYYLDSFHVVDNDNAFVPEDELKAEYSELTEVPEELKEGYADVNAMTDAMMNALVEANENGYTAQGSAAYDVKVLLTRDNGKTWNNTDADDIPNEGIIVKIPYPKNTTKESHTFSAVMISVTDSYRLGTKTGEAKILTVSAEADAVYVTVVGSAPVLLTWVQTGDAPAADNGGNAWIFIVVGVLVALAAAAVVILVIRKKRASTPVIVADEAEEIAAEEAPAEENENEVNNEQDT